MNRRSTSAAGVLGGRVLILGRLWGAWRTMILAVKDGHLVPLRKLAVAIGTVCERDGRICGSHGFELVGLEAAWRAAPAVEVEAITADTRLEAHFTRPPRRALALAPLGSDPSVRIELVPSDIAAPDPAPPPPELAAIAGAAGASVEACRVALLSPREALVLVRSAPEVCRLYFVLRGGAGAWHALRDIDVHVFDRVHALADRLAVLSLAHAGADEATVVVLRVSDDATFHPVASGRTRVLGGFADGERSFLACPDGVRELVGVDRSPPGEAITRARLEPFPGGPRLRFTGSRERSTIDAR